MNVLLRIIINAAALWVAAWALPGISIGPRDTVEPAWNTAAEIVTYLFVGLVFGTVNVLLRWILHLLAMPITCLTLGLFALVVNAGLLMLTSAIANLFPVDFHVNAFFWDAILGSIIISIVSAILNRVLVRR
ncbi:phage holin family protein [Galactobacter valiniphilus]|uniref:phage holin family protein n=1 Tax=Galactobacter valiniphilus TaxID=2676122 RepID=UPI003736986C